jgi:methyl-accepting chemotaxis protein
LLLLLSGKWLQGREMIEKADQAFQLALDTAKSNLTIPNEMSYVEDIDLKYKAYKSLWMGPVAGAQSDYSLDWYFEHGHKAFQATKTAADALMGLNDEIMYQTASNLKNRTHRIIMPGIVAIVSALVFSLVFNYFINHYFVNPIISITHEVQKILNTGKPLNIKIETKDELRDLASAIHALSCLVRK